jgi:hypothetical protein
MEVESRRSIDLNEVRGHVSAVGGGVPQAGRDEQGVMAGEPELLSFDDNGDLTFEDEVHVVGLRMKVVRPGGLSPASGR